MIKIDIDEFTRVLQKEFNKQTNEIVDKLTEDAIEKLKAQIRNRIAVSILNISNWVAIDVDKQNKIGFVIRELKEEKE